MVNTDREAELYGRYLGLCEIYHWTPSEQGFEGYKKTVDLRDMWEKKRRTGAEQEL